MRFGGSVGLYDTLYPVVEVVNARVDPGVVWVAAYIACRDHARQGPVAVMDARQRTARVKLEYNARCHVMTLSTSFYVVCVTQVYSELAVPP
ncbi:hypothetical protein DPMN_017216 [Dreissena polymorpha]|uniref:Uncharacterized protein n=1 Tax=Dreissena polymorpha TaxID=45954 RepID=A0A9D4NG86_DREPO|nr:hypothetical protein DPMN_017216 [Dreissena polymorpha]